MISPVEHRINSSNAFSRLFSVSHLDDRVSIRSLCRYLSHAALKCRWSPSGASGRTNERTNEDEEMRTSITTLGHVDTVISLSLSLSNGLATLDSNTVSTSMAILSLLFRSSSQKTIGSRPRTVAELVDDASLSPIGRTTNTLPEQDARSRPVDALVCLTQSSLTPLCARQEIIVSTKTCVVIDQFCESWPMYHLDEPNSDREQLQSWWAKRPTS